MAVELCKTKNINLLVEECERQQQSQDQSQDLSSHCYAEGGTAPRPDPRSPLRHSSFPSPAYAFKFMRNLTLQNWVQRTRGEAQNRSNSRIKYTPWQPEARLGVFAWLLLPGHTPPLPFADPGGATKRDNNKDRPCLPAFMFSLPLLISKIYALAPR